MPWQYDTKVTLRRGTDIEEHARAVITSGGAVDVARKLTDGVLPVEGVGITVDVQPVKRVGAQDGVSAVANDGMTWIADMGLMN